MFNIKLFLVVSVLISFITTQKAYATGSVPKGDPTNIKCYGVNFTKDLYSVTPGSRAKVEWLDGLFYGKWKSQGIGVNDNFFSINFDSNGNAVTVDNLKKLCLSKLGSTFNLSQVRVVAQYSSVPTLTSTAGQYPVINSNTGLMTLVNANDLLTYNDIINASSV
jgi:hypothetical protein